MEPACPQADESRQRFPSTAPGRAVSILAACLTQAPYNCLATPGRVGSNGGDAKSSYHGRGDLPDADPGVGVSGDPFSSVGNRQGGGPAWKPGVVEGAF